MKKFKVFLCSLLVAFSLFFVACSEPEDPSVTPPPTPKETTTFDILKTVSSEFDTILKTEKTEKAFADANSD